MADDLLLDLAIRTWVVVPIMIITFLVGIGRHYATLLLKKAPKTELVAVTEA